ncbi:MAG: anhydro-N-acetylmuramic acid kinase, partial [Bdellovibrionales bacterium]|nr:anhydro-N-acetylmuramic acid kinase [Bdellovibrionales bacterium]
LLSHELGRYYAEAIKKIVKRKKWKIDLVGLRGQTIFHKSGKASLQIGESSYLAQALNCNVVSDFRQADIAAGGRGAPIAGIFHQKMVNTHKAVALHNLGGISNLTFIKNKKVESSFDTGPGNLLMDSYCQKYLSIPFDDRGQLAKKGLVNVNMLLKLLRHPYLQQKPPKSCGREEFGPNFLKRFNTVIKKLKKQDVLATLTEFTAITVADAYIKNKLYPEVIYFCGGGAKNSFLLQRISYYLPNTKITTTADLGWDPQHIEGAAFAYLALLGIHGIPGNLPNCSGAKKPVVLGKIS